MKFKTTKKAIVSGSSNIIYVGYCGLQHLLRRREPIAYTSGVYGWNFDVYEVHGVTICTGYRGMPGRRAIGSEDFNARARDIWSWENPAPDAEKAQAVEELLLDFCRLNGGR